MHCCLLIVQTLWHFLVSICYIEEVVYSCHSEIKMSTVVAITCPRGACSATSVIAGQHSWLCLQGKEWRKRLFAAPAKPDAGVHLIVPTSHCFCN